MTYYASGWINPWTTVGGGFTLCDELGHVLVRQEFVRPFTRHEGELLAVVRAAILCKRGDRIVTETKNTVAWVKSGDPKGRHDLKHDAELAKRLIEEKALRVEWEIQQPRRPRDCVARRYLRGGLIDP